MKNQRGMITVDFLFAFVLVMGFSSILFALSFSLTVAEITQYVTFASARNYMAGNIHHDGNDTSSQVGLAKLKYAQLLTNPVLTPLYSNGWFGVAPEPEIGDISQQVIPEYQQPGDHPNEFWGVGTRFVARMLDFNIPFYGSTNPEGDGSGDSFNTFLGSYLGREITTMECLSFMNMRWQAIRALPVTTGAQPYSTHAQGAGYVSYDDNGC